VIPACASIRSTDIARAHGAGDQVMGKRMGMMGNYALAAWSLTWSGRRDSNPDPHLGKAIRAVLTRPAGSRLVRFRRSGAPRSMTRDDAGRFGTERV